jgi:hypothetical protein
MQQALGASSPPHVFTFISQIVTGHMQAKDDPISASYLSTEPSESIQEKSRPTCT